MFLFSFGFISSYLFFKFIKYLKVTRDDLETFEKRWEDCE